MKSEKEKGSRTGKRKRKSKIQIYLGFESKVQKQDVFERFSKRWELSWKKEERLQAWKTFKQYRNLKTFDLTPRTQ